MDPDLLAALDKAGGPDLDPVWYAWLFAVPRPARVGTLQTRMVEHRKTGVDVHILDTGAQRVSLVGCYFSRVYLVGRASPMEIPGDHIQLQLSKDGLNNPGVEVQIPEDVDSEGE